MNFVQIKKVLYCLVSIYYFLVLTNMQAKIDFASPPFTQTAGASLIDNVAYIQMIFDDLSNVSVHLQSSQKYTELIDILIARFKRMQVSLISVINQEAMSLEDIEYIHEFILHCESHLKQMQIFHDQQETLQFIITHLLEITA